MVINKRMVLYSVWPNCCNNCSFCLRREREAYTLDEQFLHIKNIKANIDCIDWKNEFSYGISLLGGEIYYITNVELQNEFLTLIDKIIDKIIKPSNNEFCRYSSVTNGLYDPEFLCKVLDKFKNTVGIKYVDLNFSYDLKYRYDTPEKQKLVLDNIRYINKRYNIKVGILMILTQYAILQILTNSFDLDKFLSEFGHSNLAFLYPHPILTGLQLDDFFFKRKDLLKFLLYIKDNYIDVYYNFVYSTKHSSLFKHTGLKERDKHIVSDLMQHPVLSDGKEILNPKCGHSILYKCYADTDNCLLCDLRNIESDLC